MHKNESEPGDAADGTSGTASKRQDTCVIVIEENEYVGNEPPPRLSSADFNTHLPVIQISLFLFSPPPWYRKMSGKGSSKTSSKSASKKDATGDQAMKTKTALLTVASIFLVSVLGLAYVYFSFPLLEEHEKQHVKLPWDIEDAKKLGQVLDRYKDRYFTEVLGGIFITYIFLQTFAIPGSIFLSILCGFLFPFPIALVLVCFCSASGASLCFLLSSLVGRRVVYKYWPERAAQWATTVKKQNDNLFNYMVFLRVTPFLPNWFINIVAPVIDVPIKPFWLGTFVGVAPPSFVAIQTGKTLHQLSSSDAKFSWNSVILLAVFATLSLIPVLVKQRLRRKFE